MKQNFLGITSVMMLFNLTLKAQVSNDPGGVPSGYNSHQFWSRAGNYNIQGTNNILGTRWASDIWIMTSSNYLGRFTQGSALSTPWDFNGPFNPIGDGLRIIDPSQSIGHLDMFVGTQSTTHIKWGASGSISGQNGRFEQHANGDGFFFNALGGNYKFARNQKVTCFVGANNYWRIGEQNDVSNFSASRRLEVLDNKEQFRLTFANPNVATGAYTDFLSNISGNLQIQPSGNKVGINATSNPTANLDVFGDVRIRNVQTGTADALIIGSEVTASGDYNVRRLDFTDSTNQVLLGNGTWGTLPTINAATNGAWVNANNEVEWGTNPLNHDTQIPMNGHRVLFNIGVNDPSTFAIGTASYANGVRMKIDSDNHPTGMSVKTYSWNNGLGLSRVGINSSAYDAVFLTGVYGFVDHGTKMQGVYGYAQEGATMTVGVRGYATSSDINSMNYGADFVANGGSYKENAGVRGYGNGSVKANFGGKFKGGDSGSLSIGVYAESADTTSYGGGTFAAYFAGSVVTTGGSLWAGSDSTLKENIAPITDLTDSLLMAIEPVSFAYKQDGDAARLNLPEGIRYGVLAQQIAPLFPSVVKTVTHPAEYDSTGMEIAASFDYKVVDMSQLVPIMLMDLQKKSTVINAQATQIQELTTTVNDLNARLTQLENCLSNLLPTLCNANQQAINQTPQETQNQLRAMINVNLSDKNAIVLNQNVPNPFAESTVITYSIPATVQKAQIHFYDGSGKLINSVEITERGNGQLNVFANDLSTGVYTYSLVADGKIVATKRMVKE